MAVGPLCVILGAGFLADRAYSVNPDAVATAGIALAVQAEAGADRLAVALEGPAAARLQDIATVVAGEAAALALAAEACPAEAARVLVVDHAGREVPADAMLWSPDGADAGAGPAPELGRVLREFTGLAVPRPLPPADHPVSVLRLPAPVDEDILLAGAFASPWTSWVTAGEGVYVALDDPVLLARLSELPGARRLAGDVALGHLRLLPGTELPDGARMLDRWDGGQLALCPEGCDAGQGWLDRRLDRDGTGGR